MSFPRWMLLALLICGVTCRQIETQGYRVSYYDPNEQPMVTYKRNRSLLDSVDEQRLAIICDRERIEVQRGSRSSMSAECGGSGNSNQQQQQQQQQSNPTPRESNPPPPPARQDSYDTNGGNGDFPERGVSGCPEPQTINDLRVKYGQAPIAYNRSLEDQSCDLNDQCGFSHSCATMAEILYSEFGYDLRCHVARACVGWEKSPGHFNIATGRYGKFGCCTTKQGDTMIRRCMFE